MGCPESGAFPETVALSTQGSAAIRVSTSWKKRSRSSGRSSVLLVEMWLPTNCA